MTTVHKGIAPIIGALLMMGVGVTGATIVFALMPSYFDENKSVQNPFDQFEIFGYSARDHSGLIENHFGSTLTCAGATNAGDMTDGDCITIFIVNKGFKPSLIQHVIVFDKVYSFNSTDASTTTCQTTSDGFSVHTSNEMTQSVGDAEEATICIKYSEKTLKINRNIPIIIESQNGQEVKLKIINGDMRE